MSLELGLFSYVPVLAADKEPTPSPSATAPDATKAVPSPVAAPSAASLQKEASDLALKEKVLNDREALLNGEAERSEKIIGKLRKKLADKDRELKQTVSDRDKTIESKISDLKAQLKEKDDELKNIKNTRADAMKTVYAKMDPKKAAKILEGLELSLANQILTGLKADQAAEILAQMDPDKARELTQWAITNRVPAAKPSQRGVPASQGDNPLQNLNPGQ